MHHLESAEDSPGNKMSHAGVFSSSRRGSNTGSGGMPAPTAGCNATLSEEQHQSPVALHHPPATGSSPPGPQHPPNSLSLHTQSLQSTGAQVKKKSGFQITSVLPAQVSASTNNSIADDTESYDDMDESHTEDLSSSDILDVSVSRATDTGIPERSSSEETLNSLHGGETPGVGSPNEPVKQQSLSQGYMVNGTVHHHTRHAQEHNKDQGVHPVSSAQTGQGQLLGSASVASSASAMSPAMQSGAVIQGRSQRASSIHAAGVDVSAAGLVTTTVTSASVSTAVGSATPMQGGGVVVVAAATSGNMPGVVAGTQPATGTTQIPASTASRFRVVKLDSSSEPFRKGRWMCTEFYEKEAPPPPSTDTAVHHRTVESFIQSESETTSGSSSCSTMSGGADPGTQPIQQTFAQTGPHVGLSQTTPQLLHSHSQDPGVHSVSLAMVSPNNPQGVAGPLGMEGQPPTSRTQQQVLYTIDSQTRQVQNAGFSANQQQTSVPVSQGVQHAEYTQISQSIQAPGVIHQIPPVQAGVAPRVSSIAALPVGPPQIAVPQALSPRPQGPAPQMVVAQGSTMNQAPQHSPQLAPEQQQQAAGGQPPHVTTLPTAKPAPTISPTSLQSNLQSGLPQTLQHGGHTSVLGLGLNHPGVQSPQLSLGRGPYGGMVTLTASKLEDAGRLLFQHQSLLSLPRLAAGGMSGLIGQTGTEVAAALGSVGDTSASATAAGSDEDSSSGASVVAIDNKIEQAMDLVKSHLMYAVREEVEVLKEQIKELIERNLQLEQENILLKNLSSPEQLTQFHAQVQSASPTLGTQSSTTGAAPTSQTPGQQGPPV